MALTRLKNRAVLSENVAGIWRTLYSNPELLATKPRLLDATRTVSWLTCGCSESNPSGSHEAFSAGLLGIVRVRALLPV